MQKITKTIDITLFCNQTLNKFEFYSIFRKRSELNPTYYQTTLFVTSNLNHPLKTLSKSWIDRIKAAQYRMRYIF